MEILPILEIVTIVKLNFRWKYIRKMEAVRNRVVIQTIKLILTDQLR